MSFSILPGVGFRRRETNHEEPNLHYHQWTFQELVPQQEQHILDHRLPITPDRPLRSNLRQRKHQVRPLRPEPRPSSKYSNVPLTGLRKQPNKYWSIQYPRGCSGTDRSDHIHQERRSTPQSRPKAPGNSIRFPDDPEHNTPSEDSAIHGPK